MFHLARLLVQSGKKVLTTTTTKILVPTTEQSETVLVAADPATILSQAAPLLSASRQITAAAALMDDGVKLKGFAPEAIRTFTGSGLFDWILVEADGAAKRPLKAPAGHEPVIPSGTTVLVAVAGLEVVGEPLSEELVFRSGLAGQLMDLSDGETITVAALARLLAHPSGAFKDAPPRARRFIFLNKADTPLRRAAGAEIAGLLGRDPCPVAESVIVGQALDGIRIHGEHRLGMLP
jgi:probable selenium-dependent hydroxylase accessory protein YqeC